MGHALSRINLGVFAEGLGIKGKADVVQVLPPGWDDWSKQSCLMVMESPEFPDVGPGMRLPEVQLNYLSTEDGAKFTGFSFPEEPKELPDGPPGEPPTYGFPPVTPDGDPLSSLGPGILTDEEEDEYHD